jgi:hypothetical protein
VYLEYSSVFSHAHKWIQSCTSMYSVIRRRSHGITRPKLISLHIMLKTRIDSVSFTCRPSMALHKPLREYEVPCDDFFSPHMFHLSESSNYRDNLTEVQYRSKQRHRESMLVIRILITAYEQPQVPPSGVLHRETFSDSVQPNTLLYMTGYTAI